MYQDIHELPSQVRACLDERDQALWMQAYNQMLPSTEEEIREARRAAWMACKDLPSSFSFKIRATVEDIDKDRDMVDVESVARHMDSFIDYGGNVQWEHGNYNVATIWDWEPIDCDGRPGIAVWGNMFGGDAVYDQMRRTFLDGKNSMSIAGEADKGRYQCDERGCYTKREVKQILEISFCEVPSNRYCTLMWYNEAAPLAKSASMKKGFVADVQEYELHRDESTCPICQLRKSLQAQGFANARATKAGVVVDMDPFTYSAALPRLRSGGNYVEWTGTGALVKSYGPMLERAFKSGYRAGYIDSEGNLNEMIARSQFEDLYRKGMLERTREGYRLRRSLDADGSRSPGQVRLRGRVRLQVVLRERLEAHLGSRQDARRVRDRPRLRQRLRGRGRGRHEDSRPRHAGQDGHSQAGRRERLRPLRHVRLRRHAVRDGQRRQNVQHGVVPRGRGPARRPFGMIF